MNTYDTTLFRLQAQLDYHERMLAVSKGSDRVYHSKQACITSDAIDSLKIRYRTLRQYMGKDK